ncbi:MAG TPA: pyridoxamine 5'-phosphate oxidase family protein [Polyangiaceae bacterium]
MMGELTTAEIDEVLRAEVLGRIGCVVHGWPYVVPVNYAYDGESIFAQGPEGLKVRAMRQHPRVCFEVEQIGSASKWKTVVVRGRFQELLHDASDRGLEIVAARLGGLDTSANARLVEQDDVHLRVGFHRPVFFQIHILERTGRFELV